VTSSDGLWWAYWPSEGAPALRDFELPPDGTREAAADTMALYFRIISTPLCYNAQQYREMFTAAGDDADAGERVKKKQHRIPVMQMRQFDFA
jgi:hypothetical protein